MALLIAVTMGGCSADVARFDSPSFNLNGGSNETAMPRPVEPLRSRDTSYLGGNGQVEAPPASAPVQLAALPDTGPGPQAPPRRQRPITVAGPSPQAARLMAGETVDVVPGDTLYGLSRRHHVSLADLMALNALQNPTLHPGQKIVLPHTARKPLVRPSVAAANRPAAPVLAASGPAGGPEQGAPRAFVMPAGDWSGSYAVRQGDSLYALAHRAHVKLADLEAANGIADARKVRPGALLKVPAGANMEPPAPAVAAVPAPAVPVAQALAGPAANATSTTRPTIINAPPQRVASLGDSVTDASGAAPAATPAVTTTQTAAVLPAAAGSTGKLRWPVNGKVIGQFGTRPDGTHNDGVNIAVPMGTEVHAADDGVIAYAGSELKGYGNLVLVRHDNGWVTAYAHNEEILVKRGDKVRRGQVVAKAGRTGEVDQPQLHFELRQGSKPVDPTPYLDTR